MTDFDFTRPFRRKSDKAKGKLIYLNENCRCAVVKFPEADWEGLYDLNGKPTRMYQDEHSLEYFAECRETWDLSKALAMLKGVYK